MPTSPPTASERVRLRLRDAMDRDAWTQREFAAKVHKSQPWLTAVLTGKNRVRLDDIDEIAEALHVPPAELIRAGEDDIVEVTPSELRLLRLYRSLSAEQQLHFVGVLSAATTPVAQKRGPRALRKKTEMSGVSSSATLPIGGSGVGASLSAADQLAHVRQRLYDLAIEIAGLATGGTERHALPAPQSKKP